MVTVSVSFHGFGTQMLSGVCQQSAKQRTSRLPATVEGLKEVFCQKCHKKFLHEPKYARGDLRNLALIGKTFVSLMMCLIWV